MQEDRQLIERASNIEALLSDIETFPDPGVHAKTREIVESLLLLYGEGLSRILSIVWDRMDRGVSEQLLDALVEDELVAHLLLLHDLHPVSIEERVAGALEQVRPYLESHGGNVELLGVEDGVARLRMQGSCSGCPSSTMTLKLAIEDAIRKVAPDLDGIEAEGIAEPQPRPVAFVSTSDLLKSRPKPSPSAPSWTTLGSLPPLDVGTMKVLDLSGSSAIFFNVEGTLYAYRDDCSACGQSLERGVFTGAEIACPSCHRHYDVRRAGTCVDASDHHLQPIPLLVHDNVVKVALNV